MIGHTNVTRGTERHGPSARRRGAPEPPGDGAVVGSMYVALLLVVALALGMAVMMAMDAQAVGAGLYAGVAAVLGRLGVDTVRRVAARPAGAPRGPAAALTIAALLLLATIGIHDMDHMRQAHQWGYRFETSVLLVNLVVLVPGSLALRLTGRRPRAGAAATTIAGPLVGLAFLGVHLFGAWPRVWGPWNRSFIALGADSLSWAILWTTVLVGTVVGVVGAACLGRLWAEDDGRSRLGAPVAGAGGLA